MHQNWRNKSNAQLPKSMKITNLNLYKYCERQVVSNMLFLWKKRNQYRFWKASFNSWNKLTLFFIKKGTCFTYKALHLCDKLKKKEKKKRKKDTKKERKTQKKKIVASGQTGQE